MSRSVRGIKGGPEFMSADFVPGRIRRRGPEEGLVSEGVEEGGGPVGPIPGDLGPIWTSGKGGGDGRRGEVEGESGAATAAAIVGELKGNIFLLY